MIDLSFSLKKALKGDNLAVVRAFLYDTRLSYGARCLAIVSLDTPQKPNPKTSVLARKIGSSPAQTAKWRSELVRMGYRIRPKNTQPQPTLTP